MPSSSRSARQLVDANEKITVKSDAVREALDYYTRLARFFPPDAPAWDDATNNKWLVAGKGALIMNPPSAWAVAKRDAPQVAEQLWTHGMPSGPKGRFAPFASYFWGIWSFGKNKSAAKSLLVHLSQPEAIEKLVVGSQGFDLPPFANMTTLKVWAEEGPPKGTLYHYPNPYNHQILSIAAAPSPPKIAQQIYAQGLMTKMTVRHMQGEPMEKTLAWAETQARRLHAQLEPRHRPYAREASGFAARAILSPRPQGGSVLGGGCAVHGFHDLAERLDEAAALVGLQDRQQPLVDACSRRLQAN